LKYQNIFNNSRKGWTTYDNLSSTLPNPNFEETNLFNLSYRITDKQGNWVLLYSLEEVITKLQGLKGWLETHVIPISYRILDISGRADFSCT
jgi:superfamily I DNA and/or RNA helicase